jgi:flagellar basal body-associated protein FliL
MDSKLACMKQKKEVTEIQQTCNTTTVMKEQKKTSVWITWIPLSVIVLACLLIVFLLVGTKFQNRRSTEKRVEY